MQIPVLLDRSRDEALTGQLVAQLRDAIRGDMIPCGTRLPSSRRLADQLGIARNTAVRAYDILVLEGYAETRPASGVFAAKPPLIGRFDPVNATPPRLPAAACAHADVGRLRPSADQHRLSFDFHPGRTNANLFPLRTWRRLLLAALTAGGAAEVSRLGDPSGLVELRTALSTFLSATRGMLADPARIIITAGAQEAFGLIARALLDPGALAVVEDPCYAGAAHAFLAAGAEIVRAPLDGDGLRLDAVPPGKAALVYVTPAHQYPTGLVMPLHRRREVVAWAAASECVIVEDDYDGDIRYEGSPLPAIAGAAPDRTIHVGSFSNTLGVGLRLGYMVVPPCLLETMQAAKALYSHGHSWLEQAALAAFIRSGGYVAHLARLRVEYRERRDTLLAALARHFGEPDVSGETSGLHLLWHLPPGMPEAATLARLARQARVGVYPMEAAGVWDRAGSATARRGILLGFGALSPRQIADGIARLSDVVDDRLDRHHDFLPELLVHDPQRSTSELVPHQPAPSLRRRLALNAIASRRPLSRRNAKAEGRADMAVVSSIYRYPIKGFSAQAVERVPLDAEKPFPFDRVFALSRGGVRIDPENPQWAKKGLFVMLMLEEALAEVRTHLDPETMRLSVCSATGDNVLTADLETPEGRAAVETFVTGLVKTLRDRPTLVRSRNGHFMDKPDNVISLINLATLRNLEERWGYPLDPLRFRANFYIDGAPPWEEFEWIGGTMRMGGAVLRVDRRNGRCGATNVNPATGRRDLEIPAALRAAFGHKDLGVYLVVERAGEVAVGDTVSVSWGRDGAVQVMPAAVPVTGRARFICRGCYYVYDEAAGAPRHGVPAGTPFAALPPDFPCPDCGTDLTKFRSCQAA
jgi:GntR family transcriptional regulator/MocR family aminotransferase